MAILRAECNGRGTVSFQRKGGQVVSSSHGVFDGIIETADDLFLPRMCDFAAGSIMFCLANRHLYIKDSLGVWREMTA